MWRTQIQQLLWVNGLGLGVMTTSEHYLTAIMGVILFVVTFGCILVVVRRAEKEGEQP